MPVDVTSRYWSFGSYSVTTDRGDTSALPERPRRAPSDDELYNHRLTGVETIEYLAWRYFGNSVAWWHVADANELAFPLDHRPGATIKIPPVSAIGRVRRTRSF